MKGQLAAARLADGFEPAALEEAADAFDPVGLIARAYQRWDRQRWPGRHGRLAYARMLYAVFILRQLEALTLRIWDHDVAGAGERLDAIQQLLNRLNEVSTPNILMRDARWLVHTAQGPLTRHLAPYFAVADRIAERFGGPSGLEIHKAGAKLTGGHLRSQLRHRSAEMSRPIDDPGVLAIARNSNSMDVALLVRDLVVLLDAYEAACHAGHAGQRLDLADAILQGVSADPELLLTRLDLLAPCTMIEGLFIARNGEAPSCSPMGASHLALLGRYRELLGRAAPALREDAAALEPSRRPYSPLAMVYGFCADILSNMALSTGTASAGLRPRSRRPVRQPWKARGQTGARSGMGSRAGQARRARTLRVPPPHGRKRCSGARRRRWSPAPRIRPRPTPRDAPRRGCSSFPGTARGVGA